MEVINARDALEAGLTRYFTGKPCRHGHTAPRLVCNGACTRCALVHTHAWKVRNPGKVAAYEAKRLRNDPDHVRALARKNERAHRARNLDAIRKRDRELRGRIRKAFPEREAAQQRRQKAARDKALALAAGRPRPDTCDICPSPAGRIVFDHCHDSGVFRGWLCDRCNRTLGQVKEIPGTASGARQLFGDSRWPI